MPIYAALLRGVNVGGNKRVEMAALRKMLADLGCADVATLLNSGNAAFVHAQADAAALTTQIEAAIAAMFGFDVTVLLRTREALRAIIDSNPFSEAERAQPDKLLVTFLANAPADGVGPLPAAYQGPETYHLIGRELYIFYPEGMGRSKLGNPQIERWLKTRATGRNWNTTLKLRALLDARAG